MARGLLTAGGGGADDATARRSCSPACPGVSTAKDVSDISGRGVGMDAVKRAVENVGGTLEIESENGRGTRFTLRLPLTVAVVNLLLVQVGEEVFGLPIAKVLGRGGGGPRACSPEPRARRCSRTATALLPVHRAGASCSGCPAPRAVAYGPTW